MALLGRLWHKVTPTQLLLLRRAGQAGPSGARPPFPGTDFPGIFWAGRVLAGGWAEEQGKIGAKVSHRGLAPKPSPHSPSGHCRPRVQGVREPQEWGEV